jgi:geranylgeranyl diphosphate synthase, type I
MKQSVKPPTPATHLSYETVADDTNHFLDNFFTENIVRSELLDTNYAQLWQTMHQLAKAGGKRLRPYFVMLAYAAYGGKDYPKIIPIAAAQELLHMSLLVHDDIIDKDYMRHGQANVAGVMRTIYHEGGAADNTEHFANSAALLAGDLLISGAYQTIINSSVTSEQKLVALSNLSDAIFLVGGGELLDTETSFRPISVDDSLKIADLKTARYSFVSPLLSGAVLAGASQEQQDLLEEFGIALGIAFQLADDLLGIYGDPAVTGKSNLGDIREGKQTYLMLQALRLADPADKALLTACLGNPDLTAIQAAQAREIVTRSGAQTSCLEKIAAYCQQAKDILTKLDIPDEHKQAFQKIITKATERTY